jgi:hypothetical protein
MQLYFRIHQVMVIHIILALVEANQANMAAEVVALVEMHQQIVELAE